MTQEIKPIAMRDALLARIRDTMAEDSKVFFVTADFGSPVIDDIRAKHADRFLNVGVAEQNLINISAGLALEGFNVFAYAIAPFITMRCFEQIRVNLCLLSQVRPMSVNLIGVGAGYSYVVSGPTHQCYEDISIMRTLPVVRVLSPSDHLVTARMFDECRTPGIRYLRLDAQVLPPLDLAGAAPIQNGWRMLRSGEAAVTIVSTGYMTHTALAVCEDLEKSGVSAQVIDIIDLTRANDPELIAKFAQSSLVVSMEEGFLGRGGVDALLQTRMREADLRVPYLPLGVAPQYNFELGSRTELHEQVGIGRHGCGTAILAALKNGAGK